MGSQAVIVAAHLRASRRGDRWLWTAITAGALGGLAGSFAYDLFRVPFTMAGFRVLAPIDSYGVLLLDASSSSPWTGLAGWSYHFINGIGFGIAYAVVARGRHWGWGVCWAMVLETTTVASPFASVYALEGKYFIIGVAYAAHVPYGIAIGMAAQRAGKVADLAREISRRPLATALGVGLVALVLWQRPFAPAAALGQGRDIAPGVSAVINARSFEPPWLRVPENGCVTIGNRSGSLIDLDSGDTIASGYQAAICPLETGVHRVRALQDGSPEPWSGGWIIVDDAE